MARSPRLLLPDSGVFHLTVRGVGGIDIVRDDRDRHRFMRFLRLADKIADWELFAFCLMTNHFHLVVFAERERMSRAMHGLNFRHAQSFNRRHERRGHLFQDRFHARVVGDDEHLLTACSYVFDNPVRAGLCDSRGDWPWMGGMLLD